MIEQPVSNEVQVAKAPKPRGSNQIWASTGKDTVHLTDHPKAIIDTLNRCGALSKTALVAEIEKLQLKTKQNPARIVYYWRAYLEQNGYLVVSKLSKPTAQAVNQEGPITLVAVEDAPATAEEVPVFADPVIIGHRGDEVFSHDPARSSGPTDTAPSPASP